MKCFFRFSAPLLALVILVTASLACGSTAPTSEPPKISTATSESAPARVPTDSPTSEQAATQLPADTATTAPEAVETFLGDAVESDGYAMTAMAVADPAKAGMFYEPENGKKLIAVDVIISNVSGDPLSVNPLNATLLDADGFTYQTELGGTDDQIDTLDLSPGEQVRGWIPFKIPEEATPAALKYSTEVFGSNFLRANLAPPPDGHTPVSFSLAPATLPSNLGDVVEQFGYSLSATMVEDPASPGFLYEPREGYKLVAVEISLGNTSGSEPLSANPLNAYLVDNNGYVYAAELGGRDGQMDAVDLGAGERVKGWVSFMIPEEATPAAIKYQTDPFSSNYLVSGLAK